MKGEIVSTRTVLSPFAEEDAAQLLALFQDADVRRYLLDDVVVSAQWMNDEIQSSNERFARNGAGLWSVRLKGEQRLLGFVGFREFFDPPQLQLLYGLLPEYWGRGLALEVAGLMCDLAFSNLGFSSVAAATDRPNTASSRVLERLGMERVPDGDEGATDTLFYVLEREQWERQGMSGLAH